MERKGLIGKEKENHKGSDNLLYTALSNSYLQGDNLKMKVSRLRQQAQDNKTHRKIYKEQFGGDK